MICARSVFALQLCILAGCRCGERATVLLVAEEWKDRVALLDAESLDVIAELETGPGPHVIAADESAQHAYVSAYRSEDGARALTVVDLVAKTARQIDALGCRHPHGVAVDHLHRVWLTCEDDQKVLVLDPRDGRILREETVDGVRTHMLLAIDDGRTMVASHLDSPWLTVFATDSSGIAAVVELPQGSEAMALAPNGVMWLTSPSAGKLTSLRWSDAEVLTSVVVGDNPIHVLANDDVVAATIAADAELAIIDAEEGDVARRLALDIMGGDVARPDANHFIVTDSMQGRVLRVDWPAGTVSAERRLRGGANHVALVRVR